MTTIECFGCNRKFKPIFKNRKPICSDCMANQDKRRKALNAYNDHLEGIRVESIADLETDGLPRKDSMPPVMLEKVVDWLMRG